MAGNGIVSLLANGVELFFLAGAMLAEEAEGTTPLRLEPSRHSPILPDQDRTLTGHGPSQVAISTALSPLFSASRTPSGHAVLNLLTSSKSTNPKRCSRPSAPERDRRAFLSLSHPFFGLSSRSSASANGTRSHRPMAVLRPQSCSEESRERPRLGTDVPRRFPSS